MVWCQTVIDVVWGGGSTCGWVEPQSQTQVLPNEDSGF